MAELPAAIFDATRPPPPSGDDIWGLEARIARVDTSIAHAEKEIAALRLEIREARDRLARLEYRVARLPGKGFTLAAIALTLLVVALLVTFQPEVRMFASAGAAALNEVLERNPIDPGRQPLRPPT